MAKLRWGILATGFIAGRFAEGIASSNTGELYGVSSRTPQSAKSFAKKHGAKMAFESHKALLASKEIDAVYIATPHPFHADLALAAAQAGKHILCEKPLALSMSDIESVQAAARAANVVLMEAYMYRCHPQTIKIADLIRKGKLGKVRLVQASFGFNAPFDKNGRLFKKELGGGAIWDVGGYPVSMACLVAEANLGRAIDSAKCHGVTGLIDPRCDTDTISHATLSFPGGMDAQISVSTQLNQESTVRIYGEDGWLEIEEPWIVAPYGGEWQIKFHRPRSRSPKIIRGREKRELYGVEADRFAEIVFIGKTTAPCMDETSTLCVNRILQDWLAQLQART